MGGKSGPSGVTAHLATFPDKIDHGQKRSDKARNVTEMTQQSCQRGPKAMQREALGETWLQNLDFKDYAWKAIQIWGFSFSEMRINLICKAMFWNKFQFYFIVLPYLVFFTFGLRFGPFWLSFFKRFFGSFWPFWQCGRPRVPKGDFGQFWAPFWAIWGSILVNFGYILVHVGLNLGYFWPYC